MQLHVLDRGSSTKMYLRRMHAIQAIEATTWKWNKCSCSSVQVHVCVMFFGKLAAALSFVKPSNRPTYNTANLIDENRLIRNYTVPPAARLGPPPHCTQG